MAMHCMLAHFSALKICEEKRALIARMAGSPFPPRRFVACSWDSMQTAAEEGRFYCCSTGSTALAIDHISMRSEAMLRIRIRMFLGFPDPLVRGKEHVPWLEVRIRILLSLSNH
jgi:hypothetical protein